MPNHFPGAIGWLELNTPRSLIADNFYRDLFLWTSRAMHMDPWGIMPLWFNGKYEFANSFMAMGAFAPSQWNVYLSADVDVAESLVPRIGGNVRKGLHSHDGWGDLVDIEDPVGNRLTLIRRHSDDQWPPQPGSPYTAELWTETPGRVVDFYAATLGLAARQTTRGYALHDNDVDRLFLRDLPFHSPPNPWIPYFRTASVGADMERARRLGAIVQVPLEHADGIGDLVVMADPAGTIFGLVTPSDDTKS